MPWTIRHSVYVARDIDRKSESGEQMTHEPFGAPAKVRDNAEERLQVAIVQFLQLMAHKDVIWYHVPNGEKRSKRTAGRLKAMGVVPGVPDLAFVLPDGRAAYMELKAPKGRMEPAQRDFREKCLARGIPHAVCADLKTALAVLVEWGILPKTVLNE